MAQQPPQPLPSDQEWPEQPGITFEEALSVGRDVFQQASTVVPSLPHRDPKRLYPATMSDALAIVHARDDAKKKLAANKVQKARHKSMGASQAATQAHYPGAVEAGGDESAFWLYMEDHFRDVTQEDLHTVLSLCAPIEEDKALHILPTGSGVATMIRQAPALPSPAPVQPALGPVSTGRRGAQQDIKPQREMPTSPSERRSVRLVTRLKMEDMYKELDDFQDDEDDALLLAKAYNETPKAGGSALPADSTATGTLVTGTTVGPASAAAPAPVVVMTIPTTTAGEPVSSLFQAVPDNALVLLAREVQALQQLAGVVSKTTVEARVMDEVTASAAGQQQQGADVAGEVNKPSGPYNDVARANLQASLTSLASEVSKSLGCELPLKLLPPRRERWGPEDVPQLPEGLAIPTAAYMHPYTKLLLQKPVPQHVKDLARNPGLLAEVPAPRPGTAPARIGSSAALPSNASQQKLLGTTSRVGSGLPRDTSSGALSDRAGAGLQATPSVPASSYDNDTEVGEEQDTLEMEEKSGAGPVSPDGGAPGGGTASRPSSRQRPVSNYALMAGRKDPVKAAAASAARKLQRAATAAKEAEVAQQHPVAVAVNEAVAAGATMQDANERWETITGATPVLAAAPQDELAAEILALQSELLTVAAANRLKLKQAVAGMLEDLPRQQQRIKEREEEGAQVRDWVITTREAKKAEQRARREAAQREAQARKGANLVSSPRPVLGRQQGVYNEEDQLEEGALIEAPFLGPDELYDVLAQRDMNDEAFCAVCGDGSSEPPNLIVYCDRCDVAVHQRCYDVHTVPEHEWLCWPCQEYEAEQRAAGVPQAQIRPPHALSLDRDPLEGGARSVKCALCPIKFGAFRKTINGQQWVHQACALWHAETYIVDGAGPAVVAGLENIPTKRWTTPCDVCGLTDGAVVSCRHPGTCQYSFHVLCARNCGLYLTVRADKQTHKPQYRAYCAIHSKAQRDKDLRASEARIAGANRAAAVTQEMMKKEEKMASLAIKESERQHLSLIRINFESCRVLVDLCKRRERLKKQHAVLKNQTHMERVQDPAAALEFLGKIKDMKEAGATQQQIIGALCKEPQEAFPEFIFDFGAPPAEPAAVLAPAIEAEPPAAVAPVEVIEPVVAKQPAAPLAALAVPDVTLTPASVPEPGSAPPDAAAPLPMETSSPRVDDAPQDHGTGTRRSSRMKRGRDEGEAGPGAGSPSPAAGGSMPPQAPPVVGQPSSKKAKTAPNSGGKDSSKADAGDLAAVERQKLLSSSEAAQLNKKLPSGLKYVPVDKLPASVADKAKGKDKDKEGDRDKDKDKGGKGKGGQQGEKKGGAGGKKDDEDTSKPKVTSAGRSTRASSRLNR